MRLSKIKIISKTGYRDRYGKDYKYGDMAELPDAIAVKLARHGLGTVVRGSVTGIQPPAEEQHIPPKAAGGISTRSRKK